MRADPQETLTPDQARAVLALAVSDTGPQPALSEQTLLVLRRVLDHGSATEGVRHLLGYDERAPEVLVAYAQLVGDEEGGSAELLVHPEHRRRGHGTALVESLLEAAPRVRVWAHGDG
ncbi:GNAT family N-acetyltransferase, partial [Segeticoccus rhizosphaerae]